MSGEADGDVRKAIASFGSSDFPYRSFTGTSPAGTPFETPNSDHHASYGHTPPEQAPGHGRAPHAARSRDAALKPADSASFLFPLLGLAVPEAAEVTVAPPRHEHPPQEPPAPPPLMHMQPSPETPPSSMSVPPMPQPASAVMSPPPAWHNAPPPSVSSGGFPARPVVPPPGPAHTAPPSFPPAQERAAAPPWERRIAKPDVGEPIPQPAGGSLAAMFRAMTDASAPAAAHPGAATLRDAFRRL